MNTTIRQTKSFIKSMLDMDVNPKKTAIRIALCLSKPELLQKIMWRQERDHHNYVNNPDIPF